MITSFTRDDKSAAELVRGTSGLNRTGLYTGLITQAELGTSASGSQYVEFAFKAKDWKTKDAEGKISEGRGESTIFLRTWVTKIDGGTAFGKGIIDALMTVLDIKVAQVQPGTVYHRTYHQDKGTHQGHRIPAFENQLVGLLLQRENETYTTDEGEVKESYRLNIVTPYDPNTMQCAKEILEKSPASLVEERFSTIKDRRAKTRNTQSAPAETAAPAAPATTAADLAETADDIPF